MPEINPEEFALPYFREIGFIRRKCPSCGSNYWGAPGQNTCGEVPCAPYSFIGTPPTKRRYTLAEMRIQFMDYFAERGHTRIKPYPIVARWRNDVYLVGASIYDFQPYATEGTMPPPANPLVISQPCIRFTDIEQVGAAGRHMSIFEMGGAHAFNYPDKVIYWKDDTVRYHHKLLSDVMGVPSESITYKEHFWSGGGNAGPDLEGIVAGLEISTLVFMQYKVQGEELIALPIRTVDTGYGMERWAWLSQGSPSGFHAVYGPLLAQVMELAKVDLDENTLSSLTRWAGIYGASSRASREAYIDATAQETGRDKDAFRSIVQTLEAAFAITDHTKSISFLLAEGVVPSNVGEGYLTRLIIRRAARLARQIGILEEIPGIIEGQVKLWGGEFHLLRDMRGEILDGLQIEVEKYEETISKGSEAVLRLSKELSSQGVRKIPTDQLVLLYDSQGLAPEIVKESAEKVGVEVDVPENFLTLVAERHSKPTTSLEGSSSEPEWEAKLKDLPATRALYYDDAYQTSFQAKIVARVAENAVVLDQTCFYPEGGGQPADHGELRVGDKKLKVTNVQKVGNTIVHFLDQPIDQDIDLVEGEIDWQRRQNLMRHHTGTHALIGAARRVLGEHVWQAGAQKEVESSRLDITHYREISLKEKERIEKLVNQVILRDLPVQVTWMAREKAEAKYGYRLYQGGAVPGSKIRVVRIQGWDAEACGGTHCKRTGELGVFKIEKASKLQDGVERIIFSAGEPALKRINQQSEALAKASELLKTTPDKLPESIKAILAERDSLEKELEKVHAKTMEAHVKQLGKKAVIVGTVRLILAKTGKRRGIDPVEVANRLKESDPKIIAVIFEVSERVQVVAAAGNEAVKAGINSGHIVSEASKVLGGGGGGRPFFATGGGSSKDRVDEALRIAEQIITEQLRIAVPAEGISNAGQA
ncbi:alanine--tRNA ligase [Candidatus Bathyarchaeota archaeon]|nr:MAG: alanine--tRNA ligase [Candidatus Bathyarchaeota archaeon]TMI44909.1 MAG: alanine--tRNA ligase [Candidatus Bathyarchaeota archaeon]